jgi:hypothetical protein
MQLKSVEVHKSERGRRRIGRRRLERRRRLGRREVKANCPLAFMLFLYPARDFSQGFVLAEPSWALLILSFTSLYLLDDVYSNRE